jgi:hypothetical protein
MAYFFPDPEESAATSIKEFSDRLRKQDGGHEINRKAAKHGIHTDHALAGAEKAGFTTSKESIEVANEGSEVRGS